MKLPTQPGNNFDIYGSFGAIRVIFWKVYVSDNIFTQPLVPPEEKLLKLINLYKCSVEQDYSPSQIVFWILL